MKIDDEMKKNAAKIIAAEILGNCTGVSNNKLLNLAADMLELASDQFANHGCNDWSFPSNWTKKEMEEFCEVYHLFNGDPEEHSDDNLYLPDYAVMSFLAFILRNGAK